MSIDTDIDIDIEKLKKDTKNKILYRVMFTLDENNNVKMIEGGISKQPTRYRNIYATINNLSEIQKED